MATLCTETALGSRIQGMNSIVFHKLFPLSLLTLTKVRLPPLDWSLGLI